MNSSKYDSNITVTGTVLLCGDLHGDSDALLYIAGKWEAAGGKPCNIFILGDVGLGFKYCEEDLNYAFQELSNDGYKIYLVRGNHDDPSFWEKDTHASAIMLKDNTVINVNGKRVFIAGGGTSVDRIRRSEGESYWKNEALFVPNHIPREVGDIYCVLSHTGPVPPVLHNKAFISYWLANDHALDADLELERIQVARLQTLRPKYWVHGHYHAHCVHRIDPDINVYALNEHETLQATFLEAEQPEETPTQDSWSYEWSGTTFQERDARPQGHVDVHIPFIGLYEALDELVENQAFEYSRETYHETENGTGVLVGKFRLSRFLKNMVDVFSDLLDVYTLNFAYLHVPKDLSMESETLCCTISREELWKLYESRDKGIYDKLVQKATTPSPGYMPYTTTVPEKFNYTSQDDFPEDEPAVTGLIMTALAAEMEGDFNVDGTYNEYAFWMKRLDPHYISENLDTTVVSG